MVERYPNEWKHACLVVLRQQREELRLLLGYKRIGWEGIISKIMTAHHRRENGILIENLSLYEQILRNWDKSDGIKISDENFRYIDEYIKRIAIEDGPHLNAAQAVHDKNFSLLADALTAFLTTKTDDVKSNILVQQQSWTLYATSLNRNEEWKAFIRKRRDYKSCCDILMGFSRFGFGYSDIDASAPVTIFNGIMVPVLGDVIRLSNGKPAIENYVLKIFRPEFAGVQGMAHADGEIFFHFGNEESQYAKLLAPYAAASPVIFPENMTQFHFNSVPKAFNRDDFLSTQDNGRSDSEFALFTRIGRNNKISKNIDDIIEKNYKNYVL